MYWNSVNDDCLDVTIIKIVNISQPDSRLILNCFFKECGIFYDDYFDIISAYW